MLTNIIELIFLIVCVAGIDLIIAGLFFLRDLRGTLDIEETDDPEHRQKLIFNLDEGFDELADCRYVIFKVNNKQKRRK